jgi:hypothetical protein
MNRVGQIKQWDGNVNPEAESLGFMVLQLVATRRISALYGSALLPSLCLSRTLLRIEMIVMRMFAVQIARTFDCCSQ